MAPTITPEVLLELSRFLKTIKNFRGTSAELGNRIAAGRANLVNAGGADAGEFFDKFMKAFGLPLGLLPAGCAKPAEGGPVTVVAYGSDVPSKSYLGEAVNMLAVKKPERTFYYFEFTAGDLESFKSGIGSYNNIEDLFIFAHGLSTKETFPYLGYHRKKFMFFEWEEEATYMEIIPFLSGIYAGNAVLACKPYLGANHVVHIAACQQDYTWWLRFRESSGITVEIARGCISASGYTFEGIEYLYDRYGAEYTPEKELPEDIGGRRAK